MVTKQNTLIKLVKILVGVLIRIVLEFVFSYIFNSVDTSAILNNIFTFSVAFISNILNISFECTDESGSTRNRSISNNVSSSNNQTTVSTSESNVDETDEVEEDNDDNEINPYDYEIPTFDRTITGYITGRSREIRAERELVRQEAEREAVRQAERRAEVLEYVRTRLAGGDLTPERRVLTSFDIINSFLDLLSLNYYTLFGLSVIIGIPFACLILYLADYGLRTRPGADYESESLFLYIRRFFVFICAVFFFSALTGILALLLTCYGVNFYYVRYTYQIIIACIGYSVLVFIAVVLSIRYNLTPAARRLAREAAVERERQAAIARVREEVERRREEDVRRAARLAEDDRSGRNTPAESNESNRDNNSRNTTNSST